MHHLPENLVFQFTHVDYEKDFRLVALVYIENSGAIIGVNIGRENGFSRFGATIDPENQVIVNFFKRSGYDWKIVHKEQGV
jgi:hypothetical protein